MKSARVLSYVFKVAAAISAAATALFFFFDFFNIKTLYTLNGFATAFGSVQGGVQTYKSTWYLVAFILAVITLITLILGIVKTKRMKFVPVGTSLLLFINMLTLYLWPNYKFDYRPAAVTASQIVRCYGVTLVLIGAIACLVLSIVAMFVTDHAEVLESNGAKLPIFVRVKNFFKDYKSEIKKIVWPSRNTVVKNVIIVIIMCVIIGAFIWILDWALAQLISLILGI